jgi:uncharacterized protein (TIGR02453 family)
MLTQQSLDFLKDLAQNNNREWYHDNKKRYEKELKKPFENLVTAVIAEVQKVDPEVEIPARKAIFRIYRDTRFSKDKTPYKTHVSAIIGPGGTKNKMYPGFYLHVEPGMLMLGGGAYFLDTQSLYQVREFIMQNKDRFNQLITDPTFVAKYETLRGEQNKRLPKELTKAAEEQPLLYNKQFYFMAELPPDHVLREDFLDFMMEYYMAAKPVKDFLKEALKL